MPTIVGIQVGVALRNCRSSQTCIRRVFHDDTEIASTMCYPSPVAGRSVLGWLLGWKNRERHDGVVFKSKLSR